MTKYVCGFAFDSPIQNVALVVKARGPNDMAGHLNGLGGVMQHAETPRNAMSRKFRQEAGVLIPNEDWMHFHTERYIGNGDTVYFMAAKTMMFHVIKTGSESQDEEVRLMDALRVGAPDGVSWGQPVYNEGYVPPMYNLSYLVPMARMWLLRPKDRYFEAS